MGKVLVTAKREYIEHVKTKGFIIGILLFPVMIVGSAFLIQIMKGVPDKEKVFTILDPSGIGVSRGIRRGAEVPKGFKYEKPGVGSESVRKAARSLIGEDMGKAVEVLIQTGRKGAVEILMERDEEKAVGLLKGKGTKEVVEAFFAESPGKVEEFLADLDGKRALEILMEKDTGKAAETLKDFEKAAAALAQKDVKKAVEVLAEDDVRKALVSLTARDKEKALEVLWEMDEREVLKGLIQRDVEKAAELLAGEDPEGSIEILAGSDMEKALDAFVELDVKKGLGFLFEKDVKKAASALLEFDGKRIVKALIQRDVEKAVELLSGKGMEKAAGALRKKDVEAAVEGLNREDLEKALAALMEEDVHKAAGVLVNLDAEQAVEVLTEKVSQDEIFSFFVVAKDPLFPEMKEGRVAPQQPDGKVAQYYSKNLAEERLINWCRARYQNYLRGVRLESLEIPLEKANILEYTPPINSMQVKAPEAKGGKAQVKEETIVDKFRSWLPVVLTYVLWIAIMVIAQTLLTNTIEEKSNRIFEVLLSSMSPFKLMVGKIIGIAGMGLTMLLSWCACFLIFSIFFLPRIEPSITMAKASAILTWRDIVLFAFFFVGGFFVYSSIYMSLGSLCNTIKDAQNLVGPITLVMMIPFFASFALRENPNSILGVVLSYIPFFTPFIMMSRATAVTPAPLYELALGIVIIFATVLFCLWAAGKIFRVGILMSGKPPKLREVIRWVRAK